MKLEVGMYVRTNLGEIAKLIEYRHFENETGNYNYLVTDKEIKKAIYDDQKNEHIIKASHNIIDLIEVEDYVNGYIVLEIIEQTDKRLAFTTYKFNEHNYAKIYDVEDIKTVLTHEQFEREVYKVE